MKKMLVADNVEMNKSILHEIFSSKYEIIQTDSSELAFKFLTQYKSTISIMLINEDLAIKLNEHYVQTLTDLKIFDNIPIILITRHETERVRFSAISLPFSDVIQSPVNPHIIQKQVSNLVELYSHKHEMEVLIQKQTAKILSQNKALRLQQRKINTINNDMLDTLSTVIEYRDVESGRHIHRIRKFTEVMLRALAVKYPEYNMNEEKINLITSASSLHDIGKIAIPDSILLSPRRLTYEEFNIMKQHTVKGCELLNQLDSVERNDYFTYCYDICRYHHEKYDGRGYPDGLKGDQIPIWAQVVSVADCYDALTSERPYKAAFSHEQAVEMIRTGACGAFSDVMMDCFGEVLDDFQKLAKEYADINHADRSVFDKKEKSTYVLPDSKEDMYRKMGREDLINTIETQKQEMEENFQRQNEVLNKISDFVFSFDITKDSAQAQKGSFDALVGYAPKNYSEAVTLFNGLCAEEYHSKFTRTFRLDNIEEEVKNGSDRVVIECPMRLGSSVFVAVRCTAVPIVEQGEIKKIFFSIQALNHSAVLSDVDEKQSDRDIVTGLWNYIGVKNETEDFLTHSGKNGRHLMILIDIDGFRQINRNTGYRFGNEILKDVGQVLRQNFSDKNILGRIEDDNFLVFVKDCPGRENEIALVDGIFRALHKQYTFEGISYPEVSACIGAAAYPRNGRSFDELFSAASKAVDVGKINGKNMYLFYNDNMRTDWSIKPYHHSAELSEQKQDRIMEFSRYFIPVRDSAGERLIGYSMMENYTDRDRLMDFDEMYNLLNSSGSVTAVDLNSLRRIFGTIYSLEEEGLLLPALSVMTIFKGYDCDILPRAFDELLKLYPVKCGNITIQLSHDMLKDMDIRQTEDLVDYFKGRGFHVGVYNVGMGEIDTKCFMNRFFDTVMFSNAFLNSISEGLIPLKILIYLGNCFMGLGAVPLLPMNADREIVDSVKSKSEISFGIHGDMMMDINAFRAELDTKDFRTEYAVLDHENQSLVLSEKMYDEILEQTRSFIFEWIPRLDTVKFSGSFERIYGYMPQLFEFTKNIKNTRLIHNDDIRKFLEKLSFARGEAEDVECLIRFYDRRNNQYVWNRVHFVAVRNAAGIPAKIMAVCADVSEERTTEGEDSRRDRTDFITNLYNKSATENKIKTYLYDEGASGHHALIIAEINGFENMETVLGKVFANAVLKETAANVRELFRDSDIIGRVSGAQFVIFVKGLSSVVKLKDKAAQICNVIQNRYTTDDGEVSITGKAGISLFPSDGRSYEELYSSALNALYYAKHSISYDYALASEIQGSRRLPNGGQNQ